MEFKLYQIPKDSILERKNILIKDRFFAKHESDNQKTQQFRTKKDLQLLDLRDPDNIRTVLENIDYKMSKYHSKFSQAGQNKTYQKKVNYYQKMARDIRPLVYCQNCDIDVEVMSYLCNLCDLNELDGFISHQSSHNSLDLMFLVKNITICHMDDDLEVV